MESKLEYTKGQLKSALQDFSASMNIVLDDFPALIRDTLKNGHVQKFEFSIELFWKTIKLFLSDIHGIETRSPKESIKKFFELEYCSYNEADTLLQAIDSRNSLSHIYKKEQFEQVYSEIPQFLQVMKEIEVRVFAD